MYLTFFKCACSKHFIKYEIQKGGIKNRSKMGVLKYYAELMHAKRVFVFAQLPETLQFSHFILFRIADKVVKKIS